MGEINIKYIWYRRVVIIMLTLYAVFITLMCLKHTKKSEQDIILTKRNHVITEDGMSWYSESDE